MRIVVLLFLFVHSLETHKLIAHVIVFLVEEMCETVDLAFEIVDGFDPMSYFGNNLVFFHFLVQSVCRLTQLHAQNVFGGEINFGVQMQFGCGGDVEFGIQ